MKEALDNARSELKRVDHLFYVSLKYTRTVDMMRHMVERMINAFSFGVDSLFSYAKENKKVSDIPSNPVMKAKLLAKIFTDESLPASMGLYLKLRQVIRAQYSKREEFRRHVTMTCVLDGGEIVEVNIDVLKGYYDTTRNFIKYAGSIIEGKEEE